ncbi:hypothetical protein TNCV_2493521 [Trichonephila clavipes]|uniref:Transposase n=1 Tax=Trichonephila clavipes TaxID=2585209 RepID=A0A8X6RXE5_TRICX|nr:hypothetical protein TNCV_2493521 [Trichonephila clavipes]
MNENRCCKKILLAKPMGKRPRGKPPLRWIYCVEKDLKISKHYYLPVVAELRERIKTKRFELWKDKSWVLHQDNAPAYVCRVVSRPVEHPSVGPFILFTGS